MRFEHTTSGSAKAGSYLFSSKLNPVIRTVILFKRILTLTKGTHVTEDNSLSLLISFSNLNILSVERDQYARIISCFFHTITLIHILCLVTG